MQEVIPWRPLRERETLQPRLDDLFARLTGQFFGPWDGERSPGRAAPWLPAIESHLEGNNLVIRADLSGLDPKAVSLSVLDTQLTIEGERQREEKQEQQDYFYQETAYGKFSRTIPLPEAVDAEKITAKYKDGVREITVPAPKEMAAKKIAIEAK